MPHFLYDLLLFSFAKCLSNHPGGLSCKLEGILESPVIDGYRNKCEFSVGHSLAGKKTVGFMLGNFRLVCCFLFLFFFFSFLFTGLPMLMIDTTKSQGRCDCC